MKWTPELEDNLIKALEGNGSNVQDACRVCQVSRETFYTKKKSDEAFAKRVESIREIVIDNVETAIYKSALEGNVTAQIFILKTIGKDRGYIETTRMEHSGDKRNPVVVSSDNFDVSVLSTEELEQFVRIKEKLASKNNAG